MILFKDASESNIYLVTDSHIFHHIFTFSPSVCGIRNPFLRLGLLSQIHLSVFFFQQTDLQIRLGCIVNRSHLRRQVALSFFSVISRCASPSWFLVQSTTRSFPTSPLITIHSYYIHHSYGIDKSNEVSLYVSSASAKWFDLLPEWPFQFETEDLTKMNSNSLFSISPVLHHHMRILRLVSTCTLGSKKRVWT